MCEELVNTLLYDVGWLEQGMTQTEHDIAEHLKKAADAIEELSREYESVAASLNESVELVDKLHKQIEELSKGEE